MSLWLNRPTFEQVASLMSQRPTLFTLLGIEITEIGEDFLRGRMPVDGRTHQIYGIMHGGASCVLAESLGSFASGLCVDFNTKKCVGMEINTSHVSPISSGWVIGTAKPLHIGKTTHLWEIPIESEAGKLVSISRLRVAILEIK